MSSKNETDLSNMSEEEIEYMRKEYEAAQKYEQSKKTIDEESAKSFKDKLKNLRNQDPFIYD